MRKVTVITRYKAVNENVAHVLESRIRVETVSQAERPRYSFRRDRYPGEVNEASRCCSESEVPRMAQQLSDEVETKYRQRTGRIHFLTFRE
jgi:hypothetical protein